MKICAVRINPQSFVIVHLFSSCAKTCDAANMAQPIDVHCSSSSRLCHDMIMQTQNIPCPSAIRKLCIPRSKHLVEENASMYIHIKASAGKIQAVKKTSIHKRDAVRVNRNDHAPANESTHKRHTNRNLINLVLILQHHLRPHPPLSRSLSLSICSSFALSLSLSEP